MPYRPNFNRIPANITEMAVGASTCAKGSQVWNGKTGTLIANPINKRTQITLIALIPHHNTPFKAIGAVSINTSMSNVFPQVK